MTLAAAVASREEIACRRRSAYRGPAAPPWEDSEREEAKGAMPLCAAVEDHSRGWVWGRGRRLLGWGLRWQVAVAVKSREGDWGEGRRRKI